MSVIKEKNKYYAVYFDSDGFSRGREERAEAGYIIKDDAKAYEKYLPKRFGAKKAYLIKMDAQKEPNAWWSSLRTFELAIKDRLIDVVLSERKF